MNKFTPFNSKKRNRLRKLCTQLILLLGLCAVAHGQNINITGTVIGSDYNESLPGVNVQIKGSDSGTVTDLDGHYSISAPSDAVLVFSYIGYKAMEVDVDNRNVINITMAVSAVGLDEIVVVGYGTQRKSDVTGSIVTMSNKELREVPVADILQGLQGRLAGVSVQSTSSRPGGGSQIRIRGNRSLGSDESGVNDPLIVVDGIPYQGGNINDLNPDLITSINILKDASATAIYGSRGANGVILITTEKGVPGENKLTYNAYYGVSSAIDHYELFNGEELADLKQWSNFGGVGGFFTNGELESMRLGRETDWQDVVFKDGYITNHELSFSGGSETTQYAVSGGFFNEETILPGQEFTRYSLRTSVDSKIGERIRIGVSSINTVSFRKGESASPMFQMLTMSPLYNAYNENGEVNELPALGAIDADQRNPLLMYRKNSWDQTRRRLRTFNTIYGEIDIIDGLKYRLNVGLDYSQDEYNQFYASNTPFRNGSGNVASISNGDQWGYTIENILQFDKAFGKHTLGLTGLFSAQEQESNTSGLNAQAIFADFIQYYNFHLAGGFTLPTNGGTPTGFNYSKWGLLSYMGRINYTFDNRFSITATLRSDGSSRLAEGNKYFIYPAFAGAWNLSNESFIADNSVFDNLKLRAGWGRTSNQAIAPFSSLGQLGRVLYSFGDQGAFGFQVNNLPNDALSWEFTSSINVGLDFSLFDYRLTGSIDYYSNKTKDVLQSKALAITSGVPGSFQENIGETKGNGVELMLSAEVIRPVDNGFAWDLDVNFSAHNEEIVALGRDITEDVGNGWFVGSPINVIYDYEKIGIWQLGEEDAAGQFGGYVPGDIKVADTNRNGTVDQDDRIILGQLDPEWTAGLSSRFSFKGFDLSVIGYANVGGNLVSTLYQANQSNPFNSLEGRRNGPKVDYWTPENPTNAFPRTGLQQPLHGATLGYFDGTYMKIRSINLGYTFSSNVLDRTGLQSARIYLTVNNPFKAFFSDYVDMGGLDPETNGRGTTGNVTPGLGRRLTVGADTPPARAFILGINLTL